MSSVITPQYIFDAVDKHFSKRDDLWHIVNGPKRETWFSAETIGALSHAGPKILRDGYRVHGEESHTAIAKLVKEFDGAFDVEAIRKSDGSRRIPDVNIFENCVNTEPMQLSIGEIKLLSPKSPKADEDAELASDYQSQLGCLRNTAEGDGLLDQLDRAKRFFPSANVFGLVYAVYTSGKVEQTNAPDFFDVATKDVRAIYEKTEWKLWESGIKQFASPKPIGGMFNNVVGIGLGIVVRRDGAQ